MPITLYSFKLKCELPLLSDEEYHPIEQSERFKQTARELRVDEIGKEFEATFQKIASAKIGAK
jgi:hypothetical protein